MERISDYIFGDNPFSELIKNEIFSNCSFRNVKKGDVIKDSEKSTEAYFVISGCLIYYFNDEFGKNHILHFATKGWWITDYISLFKNQSTDYKIECVKDSRLIVFNTTVLEELYHKYPELEHHQRKNLEIQVLKLYDRLMGQLKFTAKERYEQFLTSYSFLLNDVSNYQIASYLGITQESLSRIRAEVSTKK